MFILVKENWTPWIVFHNIHFTWIFWSSCVFFMSIDRKTWQVLGFLCVCSLTCSSVLFIFLLGPSNAWAASFLPLWVDSEVHKWVSAKFLFLFHIMSTNNLAVGKSLTLAPNHQYHCRVPSHVDLQPECWPMSRVSFLPWWQVNEAPVSSCGQGWEWVQLHHPEFFLPCGHTPSLLDFSRKKTPVSKEQWYVVLLLNRTHHLSDFNSFSSLIQVLG